MSWKEVKESITGTYRGRWSGWVFTCEINGEVFKFRAPRGVRGRIPAIAQILNSEVVVINKESRPSRDDGSS